MIALVNILGWLAACVWLTGGVAMALVMLVEV
jgi:hypothetical protein